MKFFYSFTKNQWHFLLHLIFKRKKANPLISVSQYSTSQYFLQSFLATHRQTPRVMNGSIAICSLQILSRMVEAGARKQDLRLFLNTLSDKASYQSYSKVEKIDNCVSHQKPSRKLIKWQELLSALFYRNQRVVSFL